MAHRITVHTLFVALLTVVVGCGGGQQDDPAEANQVASQPTADASEAASPPADDSNASGESAASDPAEQPSTTNTETQTAAVGESDVHLGVLLDAMGQPVLDAAQTNLIVTLGAAGSALANLSEAATASDESDEGAEEDAAEESSPDEAAGDEPDSSEAGDDAES